MCPRQFLTTELYVVNTSSSGPELHQYGSYKKHSEMCNIRNNYTYPRIFHPSFPRNLHNHTHSSLVYLYSLLPQSGRCLCLPRTRRYLCDNALEKKWPSVLLIHNWITQKSYFTQPGNSTYLCILLFDLSLGSYNHSCSCRKMPCPQCSRIHPHSADHYSTRCLRHHRLGAHGKEHMSKYG